MDIIHDITVPLAKRNHEVAVDGVPTYRSNKTGCGQFATGCRKALRGDDKPLRGRVTVYEVTPETPAEAFKRTFN